MLRITGAIDRREPDPQAPSDPLSAWIGNVQVSWVDVADGPLHGQRVAAAALIQVCTGRGSGDVAWGKYVLQLRWIGDPPPPEIADTVYDYVRDGGPSRRPIARTLVSQPRSEAQPSYRVARVGAA